MGSEIKPARALRLWPGVSLAIVLVLGRFGVPLLSPANAAIGLLTGLGCAVLIFLWWLFFSRAAWSIRLWGLGFVLAAFFTVPFLVHPSIQNGMMGMMFMIFALPLASLALVVWALIAGKTTGRKGIVLLTGILLAAIGSLTLIRTDGLSGSGGSQLAWRWSPTPEDRLLQNADLNPVTKTAANVSNAPIKWAGFRGSNRDGVVRQVQIQTNWQEQAPNLLWKKPVGPGWSSFAVSGDVFYTQEQRGEDEVIACYDLRTGQNLWMHRDAERFWESNAGAGPRGTPTLVDDRVYAFGGTGMVNVLNASNGQVIWSRNAAKDTKVETPMWGFSSSPLVLETSVVVAVSGTLVAYHLETGAVLWTSQDTGVSYSSPQLLTLDQVPQIVQIGGEKTIGVNPQSGALLWEHAWSGYPIVQPALTPDGDLLISVTDRSGIRRLAITQNQGSWQVEERWTTRRLKPYFNDFVIHNQHAYGFDGSILGCIELEAGKRQWKGGRYGQGQLLLLAEQDLLVVLSEKGDLVLVSAKPDQFKEIAKIPAIEGKTWNHPVLVDNLLLIRNDQEMAAVQIQRQDSQHSSLLTP